ncbi:iron chaperone [Microbacterium sp. NPDC058345]|uniref:iron chaperone n=1 Tax=Microbacterium sp. NPDC058345 TaxID=3346455 RepID=UPI003647D941
MAKTGETANFTAEEREAMKAAASEKRTARSRAKKDPEQVRREGEAEVLAKIAELSGSDKEIAEALHELVGENAPHLVPRTYYGMPAWGKDGKVLCFFQPASKFKVRYATFGFETNANLDDGDVWPTSFAVTKLGEKERAFFADLVRRAAS